jgi:glycosyltransferase involved in cell wall biosynthesis
MKITIITPCSRPGNLKTMVSSINPQDVQIRWIIVFDSASIPPVELPEYAEAYCCQDSKSICGNAQRNFALNLLGKEETFVIFLDDDTIIHPRLFAHLKGFEWSDFIHYNQSHADGRHRIGGTVKVNRIDTGSAVISSRLIGKTRWILDRRTADGYFMEEIFKKARSAYYINETLSIYNALKK